MNEALAKAGQAADGHAEADQLADDLAAALEELHVAGEELQQQNEELIAGAQALEAETRRYRDLFEHAPDAYLTTDADGVIRESNGAASELFGVVPKYLAGRLLALLVADDQRDKFRTALAILAREPRRADWEFTFLRRKGQPFPALISVAPHTGPQQKFAGFRWLVRDNTTNEKRFRTLFDGMTEAFAVHEIVCDENGRPIDYRFLDVNPAFERLTGLKREDTVGCLVTEVLPGTEMHWIETYGTVALTGEPIHFEEFHAGLGKHYEVFSYSPAPRQFAVIFMDISERKRNEKRIARLTSLYSVLSRVNEAIVRIRDENALFDEACRIVAAEGAYPLVWIGELNERTVANSSCCGPAREYLKEIVVEIDGPLGQGPTGTCIRENRPVINDDFDADPALAPWREAARRHGFRASAAFPLRRGGKPVGALTLYAAERGAFDAEQVKLLESLAADISYALDALTEERLRLQSEDRLTDLLSLYERRTAETEALIDALPHAVYFGNETGITRCNDLALRLLGASSLPDLQERIDEIDEKFRVRYRHGGVVEPENLPFVRALRGEIAQLDMWATQSDTGADVLIRGTAAPVVVGGNMIGAVAVNIDITDHFRAEQSLREIAETLEQRVAERTEQLREQAELLDLAHDAIFVRDLDGRIGFWNRGAEVTYGWTRGEAQGRISNELLQTQSSTPLDEIVAAIRDRGFWNGELRHSTKDGRTLTIATRWAAKKDADGNIAAILEINRDVSARKAAEERLQAANAALHQRAEQLRALAEALTQAEDRERRRIAQILHDNLQQLLAGATLQVASVKFSVKDEPVAHGLALVESLLRQSIDASRSLTAELAPPILYDGGLEDALHWLARWVRDKHGLEVEVEAEEGVEASADARLLLFQAARELLFNVKKHAGVDRAKIRLGAWGADQLKLSVTDEGKGFDAEQGDKRDSLAGGFGLFSIRERIEWIGGRLEISGAPGQGARVTVVAPRFVEAPPEAPEPAVSGEAPAAEATAYPGAPIRVLVADDHRIVRQGLVRLLRESPDIVVVGEAEDGRQAVELTRRLQPDVVVMDITMPHMNGIDATRAIMADRPHTRVIGLSMHSAGDMKTAMVEAGAATYLPKDGPAEALIGAIRGVAREEPRVGQ